MKPSKYPKQSNNATFFAVMKKTRGRCFYCGAKKWPAKEPSPQPEITIDHFLPISRGGTDDLDNLVPACRICNSSKCERTIEDMRHNAAQRRVGMPNFSREQIAWLRARRFDLSRYDGFLFWFERRTNAGTTDNGLHEKLTRQQ